MVTFTRSARPSSPDPARPEAAGPGDATTLPRKARPADRRALIVLMAVIIGLGLGGIGYVVLLGGDDSVTTGTGGSSVVRSSGSPGAAGDPAGPASTSGTGAAATSPTAATSPGAAVPTGRNPFGGSSDHASAGTSGTPGVTGVTGTTAPSQGPAPATTVTERVTATVTQRSTVTATQTATVTATVTVTATASGGSLARHG